MISLFLDTSYYMTVGILDSSFNWLSYEKINEKKGSAAIHALINSNLEAIDKNIDDVNTIFYVSGPGSYTGIRLASGIAQIFELVGKNCISFYHYDILELLNIKNASWISNAYKGEFFIYSLEKSTLVSKENVLQEIHGKQIYTHFKDSISDLNMENVMETSLLIKENSDKIFSVLANNGYKKKDFYYRTLDNEFNKEKSCK